jgi:hypothetical protein
VEIILREKKSTYLAAGNMHFGALDYIGVKTKKPVNDKFTGFCICLPSILAEKEGFEPPDPW